LLILVIEILEISWVHEVSKGGAQGEIGNCLLLVKLLLIKILFNVLYIVIELTIGENVQRVKILKTVNTWGIRAKLQSITFYYLE
jgi:hypothetical protein